MLVMASLRFTEKCQFCMVKQSLDLGNAILTGDEKRGDFFRALVHERFDAVLENGQAAHPAARQYTDFGQIHLRQGRGVEARVQQGFVAAHEGVRQNLSPIHI